MFANSKGQKLSEHLFAVGYLAGAIARKIPFGQFGSAEYRDEITKLAMISGFTHDIGKVELDFQEYIRGIVTTQNQEEVEDGYHSVEKKTKKIKNIPTHNEISWWFIEYGLKVRSGPSEIEIFRKMKSASYIAYWHHAQLLRENGEPFSSRDINDYIEDQPDFFNEANQVLEEVNELIKGNDIDNILFIPLTKEDGNFNSQLVPPYKEKSAKKYDFALNVKNLLVRFLIVSADRIISRLTPENLSELIQNKKLESLVPDLSESNPNEVLLGVKAAIDDFEKQYPESISERTKNQKAVVREKIKENKINILSAPAGYGKTITALMWHHKNYNNKPLLWVCPRTAVCDSVYNEIKTYGLKGVKLEVLTGSNKQTYLDGIESDSSESILQGNIIITTVDQIFSIMVSHYKTPNIGLILESNFVFDEFHELRNLPSMFYTFGEFLSLRSLIKVNTLLLSATPNPAFFKFYLQKGCNELQTNMIEVPSFNEKKFELSIIKYKGKQNPMDKGSSSSRKEAFVYNTAVGAQRSFLKNYETELASIAHSMFTGNDKKLMLKQLFDCFGKQSLGAFNLLRSGPYIKASFNISFEVIHADPMDPDSNLQLLGRKDRWGEWDLSYYKIYIPIKEDGSINRRSSAYMAMDNNNLAGNSTDQWLLFLEQKTTQNKIIDLKTIYDWYREFYSSENPAIKLAISEDLLKLEKEANLFIDSGALTPTKLLVKTSSTSSSGSGFRGTSLYVMPVLADNTLNPIVNPATNDYFYLYDPKIDKDVEGKTLTLEKDRVVTNIKQIDSNMRIRKNMYSFNKYQKTSIERWAKRPDYPIYLKFTKADQASNSIINYYNEFVYIPFAAGNGIGVGLVNLEQVKKGEES